MSLKIAGIVPDSVVDGPGIRYVIFTQGCEHYCKGCHNQETWDKNGGIEKTDREILRDIKKYKNIKGITLSGGDPFLQAEELVPLVKKIKVKYGHSIVAYTGYLYEEILDSGNEHHLELLELTDILIDGPFKVEEKDLNIPFRGSRNQRIIDVKKSSETNGIVLYKK